jgi:hypothetical protein
MFSILNYLEAGFENIGIMIKNTIKYIIKIKNKSIFIVLLLLILFSYSFSHFSLQKFLSAGIEIPHTKQ